MGGGGCIGDEAGNAASGLKGPLQAGRRVWTWFFSYMERFLAGERQHELYSRGRDP